MDKILEVSTQAPESNNQVPFEFSKDLDAAFLSATYGSNLAFGVKMFGIFVNSIQQDLDILESSATNNDYSTMRAIAHKIKNNFTWVGLSELSKLTGQIETLASEENSSVVSVVKDLGDKCSARLPFVEAQYRSLEAATTAC